MRNRHRLFVFRADLLWTPRRGVSLGPFGCPLAPEALLRVVMLAPQLARQPFELLPRPVLPRDPVYQALVRGVGVHIPLTTRWSASETSVRETAGADCTTSSAWAQALSGRCDLALGILARAPSVDRHGLTLLQVLIDGEELLDLLPQEQRQALELLVPIPVRIVEGHADDLVIDALLVAHLEHAEW